MHLTQTIIRFPEIQLRTRDAHKLRGYFGKLFKEHSQLLHNHMGNGEFRHRYPLVQYKVIDRIPTLVGIQEGSQLLTELFLKIDNLVIEGKTYPVHQKNITGKQCKIGVADKTYTYKFLTLWMSLNQENYDKYIHSKQLEKQHLLERILIGNCLSFFKNLDLFVDRQLRVNGTFNKKTTRFKNNKMLAFEGLFSSNVLLPDYVGIGKAVSRGFGTIKHVND